MIHVDDGAAEGHGGQRVPRHQDVGAAEASSAPCRNSQQLFTRDESLQVLLERYMI